MLGPEGVARAIADNQQANVVAELAAVNLERGDLGDGSDPDDPAVLAALTPQLIVPRMPRLTDVAIDEWPFIATTIRTAPMLRAVDVADDEPPLDDPTNWRAGVPGTGGVDYTVTYNSRTSVWVRADGYDLVGAIRDRLLLAVRCVMLRHQRIGAGGVVRLVEQQLTENYAPTGFDEDLQANIGAGYIDAQYTADERLLLPSYGPADVISTPVAVATVLPPE